MIPMLASEEFRFHIVIMRRMVMAWWFHLNVKF